MELAKAANEVRAPSGSKRVLVVTGDDWLQWRLEREFEQADCAVTLLPRLRPTDLPALAAFDVVLTDAALLPEGGRLEALRSLREVSPRARFVLLVGPGERGVGNQARRCGFDLVLERPTSAEALSSLVRTVATGFPPHPQGGRAGATVLLVDDDAAFAAALCRMLAQEGYGTCVAGDAAQALQQLQEGRERIDLVIADLDSSRRSGLKLLLELHRQRPNLPVILLSASPDAASYLEALRLGAYEYLAKPVDFDELRGVAQRALRPARRTP